MFGGSRFGTYARVPTNLGEGTRHAMGFHTGKVSAVLVSDNHAANRNRSAFCCFDGGPQRGVYETHPALQVAELFGRMAFTHAVELLGITLSFMFCLISGSLHREVIDPTFFHATGLLLAVLLSLRAKTAMSRRVRLMVTLLKMMNCARNLLEIAGLNCMQKRRKLMQMLAFVFAEVANFIQEGDEPEWHAPKIEDFDEAERETVFRLRGKRRLAASPRPLIMYLRQFCDNIFDVTEHTLHANGKLAKTNPQQLEQALKRADQVWKKGSAAAHEAAITGPIGQAGHWPDAAAGAAGASQNTAAPDAGVHPPAFIDPISVIRRWHRNIERELHDLTNQFDVLLLFKERLITSQFRWMLGSVKFLYVALYPWCVKVEAAIILISTTLGMAFVFYGLTAMTEQLEDPILHKGQGFNLALTFEVLFKNLDREDTIREQSMAYVSMKKRAGIDISEKLHEEFVEMMSQHHELSVPGFYQV
eukprot:NODE_5105_length_1807_cov_15.792262.p1 GENE.NODE_5105_length_1807_cov_15.792262~~NODE_5105_length_1807_cov_15.792262.p1  ORF type:complete len:475 (+),score=106.66 NODE_5105_length_1807_cov_15.792262:132-1556(+)